jgi:cell division protein FtsZ
MVEDLNFELPSGLSSIIKVLGVGGGGSNAVNHMFSQGIKDVNFVVCNTDAQALQNSPVAVKIQLGENLTEGRGAGSKPEIGRKAAMESMESIKEVLSSNTKMVFITAGMGGGTGTGAAPIIAKAARELGLLTVAIVTIPFRFEGQQRIDQAIQGINELQQYVDSLLVINNEKLREVFGDLKLSEAFSRADDVLATAAKGIARHRQVAKAVL